MCRHVCRGGSALLNSEGWGWLHVLLFLHCCPQGSCDEREVLSVAEALGPLMPPHLVFFSLSFVFFLYAPASSLFLTTFPTFFYLLVEILLQSILRNPPGPAKTRWNAQRGAWSPHDPFFFFLTTRVQVCFIYTGASHNKSDLMTLSKYSSSRFKS